ncbi:hypothetical protein OGATHE_002789 [Ogataea polymorpha]|uniref:Uncharacterized protein n=1 Tax=Ogataea polymorpha TaxID=460523 RepID=A0A9P8T8K8_9ASCO|nr:hypothetical protein OGATHE_002789 [Ogataea polymorpha]
MDSISSSNPSIVSISGTESVFVLLGKQEWHNAIERRKNVTRLAYMVFGFVCKYLISSADDLMLGLKFRFCIFAVCAVTKLGLTDDMLDRPAKGAGPDLVIPLPTFVAPSKESSVSGI